MSPERVVFTNSRGQRLVGLLHGRLDGKVVLSCHGMLSTKDSPKHCLLAEELGRRGLPVLRFDFAGRGESDGELVDLSISNEMDDLDAALEFLASRGAKRFGLFGSSLGGAVALLAAARDERVTAIATLAALAHPEAIGEHYGDEAVRWLRQGYLDTREGRIGPGFVEDARRHSVLGAAGVLRAALLVVHGDQDEMIPCSDGHDIATAARNVSLELVVGADHQFTNPAHLRVAVRQVADFLAKELGKGA